MSRALILRVSEDDRVLWAIGGLHLLDLNYRVEKTIENFKENNIRDLYPCHCTSFAVKTEIHKTIKLKGVWVGVVVDW